MSKKYIEKDLLKSELRALSEQERLAYMGVYDCVNSIPTADVKEIQHGYNATDKHPVDEFDCYR